MGFSVLLSASMQAEQNPDLENVPSNLTGMGGVTLVLGGARSGKSRYAEALVTAAPKPWTYLATGRAFDDEMRLRIAQHQQKRVPGWTTCEEPIFVEKVLDEAGKSFVLLDCLTLWLTNLILAEQDVFAASERLLEALRCRKGRTVLVGNEVGLGIVPDNVLSRRFRDEAGILHQRIAAEAGRVVFVAAGLPLVLK